MALPSNLTHLKISGVYGDGDFGSYLPRTLMTLKIPYMNFNKKNIENLPLSLTFLKSKCDGINGDEFRFLTSHLPLLSTLKITSIIIDIDIHDDDLEHLCSNTVLKCLVLNGCKKITDRGIKYLPLQLTCLKICNRSGLITRECFTHLLNMNNLTNLYLCRVLPLTGNLDSLFPSLRKLTLLTNYTSNLTFPSNLTKLTVLLKLRI